MRLSGTTAAVLRELETPGQAPLAQGVIAQGSIQHLPMDAGCINHMARPFLNMPPTSLGWSLRGGMWDEGAAKLPEALPHEPPMADLELALAMVDGLRGGALPAGELARHLAGCRPDDHEALFRSFAYALEMLGVSNRQIRLYSRKNFELASSLVGEAVSPNLLKKAMRVRAAIEPFVAELARVSQGLGEAFGTRSALSAVEQGGVDAGLCGDDACANAPLLIDQLEVFNGTRPLALRPASPSADDLANGLRALASQHSIASVCEPAVLADRLARRLNALEFDALRAQPAMLPPALQAPSGSTLKRRRGSSSVFAQDQGNEPVRLRHRSVESYGDGDRHGMGSRISFAGVQPQDSMAARPDWRSGLLAAVRDASRSPGGLFPPTAFQGWLDAAALAGANHGARPRSEVLEQMLTLATRGWFESLPRLREAASRAIQVFVQQAAGAPAAQALSHLGQAVVFPLVEAFDAAPPTSIEGLIFNDPAGRAIVGFPCGQDLSGGSRESVERAMRVMTRLILNNHLASVFQRSQDASIANAFNALAKRLLDVSRHARVPPSPNIDALDAFEQHSVVERAQAMVVDTLAAGIAERVLGLPSDRPAFAHRQTWCSIVSRGLDRLGEPGGVCVGLMQGDPALLGRAFESIERSANRWLAEVRPAVRSSALVPLVRELVKAANAGRNRDELFTDEEVLSRLEDNLWLFMATPYMGAVTREGEFVPAEDHAVGFIHHAVLEQRLPRRYEEEAAKRIVDSCMLALVSRDRDGIYNLMLDLAMKACCDPDNFAVEFMGDLSSRRAWGG